MEGLRLLQTASVLLLLTASGGLLMAVRRLGQKLNPPDWLAMAHGFLAAAAFTLLAYAMVTRGLDAAATFGFILLVIAAIGGVVMNLAYHLAGKLIPSWLLHVHIGLGAIGTLLICWAAWFA